MRPHPLLVVNDVALATELARGRLPPTLVTQKSEWNAAMPMAQVITLNAGNAQPAVFPGEELYPVSCMLDVHRHVRTVIAGETERPFLPWQPPSIILCDPNEDAIAASRAFRLRRVRDLLQWAGRLVSLQLPKSGGAVPALPAEYDGMITASVHLRALVTEVRFRLRLKSDRRMQAIRNGRDWGDFGHDEPYLERLEGD